MYQDSAHQTKLMFFVSSLTINLCEKYENPLKGTFTGPIIFLYSYRYKTSGVAVGGGIIRGTKSFHKINPKKTVYSKTDAFCIVFLQRADQEADFNAYSFVIVGDDLSKEEFEEELLKVITH